jgi:hypothetical protein
MPNPIGESVNIATMPLASSLADGINYNDNINTNTNPGLNEVSSMPGDGSSHTPIISGADNMNQFPVSSMPDNINTNTDSNNAISPGGGNSIPVTSGAVSNDQLPPNNAGTLTGESQLYQPLENSTSRDSNNNQFPNTNDISATGGSTVGTTSTNNNQPLEGSTSLNSITPSSGDAKTNQVLDKESLLRSELQEIIQGDQECNDLYDDTIITWKNIVDRTKNIQKQFGLADTDTTTTTTEFEICGNNQDDDGDGLIDETCPDIDDPDKPEICRDGEDNDGDGLVDEGCVDIVIPDDPEIPNDEVDNDMDSLIDETCSGFPVDFPPGERNFNDGKF